MNTFGLSTSILRGAPDAAGLALAATHGFHLVEVIESDGILDLSDSRTLQTLKAAMSEAAVTPSAVTGPLLRAEQLVDAAAALEAPLITLRSFRCSPTGNAATAGDPSSVRKILERLSSRLEQSGLRVALDFPAWRGLDPDSLREFIDGFENLPVGAVLDVGHTALQFTGYVPETAEALSGFLASVRLHDNNGRDDAHRSPGAGSIDWASVLTACWKTGFTGPWILDLIPQGGDPSPFETAVGARARLQAILEDLSQPFAFTE
jgi:sugar phosphate isomerase/epimerase